MFDTLLVSRQQVVPEDVVGRRSSIDLRHKLLKDKDRAILRAAIHKADPSIDLILQMLKERLLVRGSLKIDRRCFGHTDDY